MTGGGTEVFVCPRCQRVSSHPDDLAAGYCGWCHDWTAAPRHTGLRFRLFVERRQVAEAWVDLNEGFELQAARVGVQQTALAEAADKAGLTWHVEVWDPQRPPNSAYARLGTNPGAMVIPIEITPPQPRKDQP